ncbi:MAG: putative glycosyl transferase [Actinomycetia bacterium]|nr:putative glycosyl transferase [Actinomycetes bacterium]
MQQILFLTRGHGYGHAATDLPIIEHLRQLLPAVEIKIASYGTGLEYYRLRSVDCADLAIDDNDDQTTEALRRVLLYLRTLPRLPDLIVSDELFLLPRLCKRLGIPNVLLTHWFFKDMGLPELDAAMDGANAVIVVDFPDAHCRPDVVGPDFLFSGPLAREIDLDRPAARTRLGLDPINPIAVLTLGSTAEFKVPDLEVAAERYLRAWAARATRAAVLYVLVEKSFSKKLRFEIDSSVRWIGVTPDADTYYAASDIILTSSSLNSLGLLGRNGLKGLTLIGHVNEVERLHGEYFAGLGLENIRVVDESAPIGDLTELIDEGLTSKPHRVPAENESLEWGDPAKVSTWIASYLD